MNFLNNCLNKTKRVAAMIVLLIIAATLVPVVVAGAAFYLVKESFLEGGKDTAESFIDKMIRTANL